MNNINWLDPEIYKNASKIKESKNCPNCGAPIEADKCPYCGTVFVDFTCMDVDKPFFMKIKKDDKIFIVKVMLRSLEIRCDDPYVTAIDFGNRCLTMLRPSEELSMTFDILH